MYLILAEVLMYYCNATMCHSILFTIRFSILARNLTTTSKELLQRKQDFVFVKINGQDIYQMQCQFVALSTFFPRI